MTYFVYLVTCNDGTLYTGISTDVTRRVMEHNGIKRAARYTRVRQPVTLYYQEECTDRSSALRREYILRHLSHQEKLALANTLS